jgi:hypothetical protein
MKPHINIRSRFGMMAMFLCIMMLAGITRAQENTAAPLMPKPVKNTFESGLIIDNQTVMVPKKKSLEMIIQHRFGTWEKGYEDLYGMFAPANISLGLTYTPIENLQVGLSIIKMNMTVAGSAKYSLLKQTNQWKRPVSVTYFGEMEIDTRQGVEMRYKTDRYIFFHQLLIARKITKNLSLQVAPGFTHVNVVDGYYSDSSTISPLMKHNHLSLAVSARYKISDKMNIMLNYDQPLTIHPSGNPYPNLSLGVEFSTSSHSFQVFAGNYSAIAPGRNNYFNKNSFIDADNNWNGNNFLIGFNIERLWNF